MNQQDRWRILKSDYLKLIPIVALAFYIAFIPHVDYPYPVHIDEWRHIAHNNALLEAADIDYQDPFTGLEMPGGEKEIALLEVGYHIPFSIFYRLSGLSWMDIHRFFPSIIFALTVISAYILARRMGFGWEAALFACLVPTTVGIMGPDFLVPVGMGLLYVPLLLFLVFNFRTIQSYIVLFVFTCFLMTLHAPSAICIILVLLPFILISLVDNFRHGAGIILAIALPILVTLPWTMDLIISTGQELFVKQPLPAHHDLPRIIKTYGYIPFGICLFAVFVLAIRGGKNNYSLLLGLLMLTLMLAVFYTAHYGVGMMYLRGLLYVMLMMGIIAGAGVMEIRKLEFPGLIGLKEKYPLVIQSVGTFLCLALIGATLAVAIPARQNIPYYNMIDDDDYEAFVWIKENVGEEYETAILDPWKGTPFTAITGKYVYTKIHSAPKAKDEEAYNFLKGGCSNTAFLRENGISIVYTGIESDNPDLVEVFQDVYILKEDAANQ